eukprot:CAMPEP_0171905936 /NCGR_PEP_ID=MMETSP0993-20121228/5575_1 /TAXON_ID=483369 /ORGANISM="non described non described, Strain CCMP2098" /LENGTH=547 /DNA_ID=CAMNT_0012537561 /DNA_START=31 /DNA_END=1674 /DNA_ORIENTATION=-
MMLATAAPTHAFALPVRRPLGLRTPLSSPHLRAPIRQSPLPVHPLSSVGGVALRLSGGSAPLTALAPTGFNAVFLGLVASVALLRTCTAEKKSEKSEPINPGALSLQRRFLAVFWLFRLADWLQGPYFVEVYTSKVLAGGATMGVDTIAKLFLTGFGTTALLGPFVGKWVDRYGRKKGSIAFAAFYIWAALAVRSSSLPLLFLGRVMGGIGTSLLFSAPEAWLVGEHQKAGYAGASLGATFGLAYFGDSFMAMGAGQLAQVAASTKGPAAPFTVSTAFLALGAVLASVLWRENTVGGGSSSSSSDGDGDKTAVPAEAAAATESSGSVEEASAAAGGGAIKRAFSAMVADPRILLVGSMQAFFEGAMYIFVLQWPRALRSVMTQAAAGASVPYGKIFSCFMACCMFGSSVFPALASKGVRSEASTSGMLGLAFLAMASSAAFGQSKGLTVLAASFFLFEACVGFYFPSIGTLRSKYLPDEHRSIIMNLFAVPLNLIVVAVYLQIARLGTTGALWCSTASLGLSFLASLALRATTAASPNASSPATAGA